MSGEQKLLQAIAGAAILGFQTVSSTSIVHQLRAFEPNSGTKLRDAIAQATDMMIALQSLFLNSALEGEFNFVHVILTDGDDTSSQIKQYQLIEALEEVSGKIPRKLLRTIYIGVDLTYSSSSSLQELANASNGEFYNVGDNEIEQIFQKITIQLNLITRRQALLLANEREQALLMREEKQLLLEAQQHKYLVMFTIDGSGSMEGHKWSQVCNAVSNFIDNLGDDDLVSGIIFNDALHLIRPPQVQQQRIYHSYQPSEPRVEVPYVPRSKIARLIIRVFNYLYEVKNMVRLGLHLSLLICFIFMTLCAVYAAGVENENTCYSSGKSDQPHPEKVDGAVNVTQRFSLLLIFFAVTHAIIIVRIYCFYKKVQLKPLIIVLNINFIVHFIGMIILLIWRFNDSGHVCSGDYATDYYISLHSQIMQVRRGSLIKGMGLFQCIFPIALLALYCLGMLCYYYASKPPKRIR